jgi:DNA-binding transcriptional LysR family regulator
MDYVYTVYRERSFTKAAEKLYISQPALSSTVKKLEKDLGYPIFERQGKEIVPTCLGEKYIHAVEEIRMIQKNLEQEIDDLLQLKKGKIVLGSTTFIVSNVLPQMLKQFRQANPNVEIEILVEQSTVLREKLEKGLVDIAIDNALERESDYTYLPLLRERILLGVPAHMPENEKFQNAQIPPEVIRDPGCDYEKLPKVPVKAFSNMPFILLKSGNKMRQIAGNIFVEGKVSPRICFEFDQLMTSISFAEGGFGACFLTDTILRYVGPYPNIVCYQPDTKYADRTLYIMHKKNKYLPFASRALIDFLRQQCPPIENE